MAQTPFQHWRIETDPANIAWLYLDVAGRGANVLSSEVVDELALVTEQLLRDRPRGVVLASAKASGFIAGADIREFAGVIDADQVAARLHVIHDVMARFERLPFPSVARIQGFCLGGGLELALCCRYRIAADDDSGTRLGFPEVQLGIHPGAGGSMRSIRAVGPIAAMDLMLSGRLIDARRAQRIGLVDRAVPGRHLDNAARLFVRGEARPHRLSVAARLADTAIARPVIAQALRRQVAKRAAEPHFPAPYALIDLWRAHGGSEQGMLRAERQSFARLLTTETSHNLVRLFLLQERLKERGKSADFDTRHVHVVGAGTMGGDIAAWCAYKGCQVTLQDRAPKYLAPAIERAHALCKRRIRNPRERTAVLDRLVPDLNGHGIGRADIVIEAIVEDRDSKRRLFADIEPRMKPGALLATNTSSIPLEQLEEGLTDPARLVGLHFFNPVASMRLVEIIGGPATATTALDHAAAFITKIDRLPLPVRSSPGFLINRILLAYMLEAVHMIANGTPAEVIDAAMRAFGMPVGPVELADSVGLDICLAVARVLAERLGVDVPAILEQKVAQGRLGRKTQRGFYEYRGGKHLDRGGHPHSTRVPEITDRLVLKIVNESIACLREHVVADADLLDAGMVFGTGFAPFRGGPMCYLRARGVDTLRARLHELGGEFGADFHPDSGWNDPKLWLVPRSEPGPADADLRGTD